jgi:ABC-type phosphate transport system permease subunit
MGWVVTAAFFVFLLWRGRRGRENAAERMASGESRSPLYWIGSMLAMSVVALTIYMAHLRSSGIQPALWVLAIVLFVATLFVRRALKWRYPH